MHLSFLIELHAGLFASLFKLHAEGQCPLVVVHYQDNSIQTACSKDNRRSAQTCCNALRGCTEQ